MRISGIVAALAVALPVMGHAQGNMAGEGVKGNNGVVYYGGPRPYRSVRHYTTDVTQPNNPNSVGIIQPYHTDNFCPAGLRPVTIGGVICCGVPNAY